MFSSAFAIIFLLLYFWYMTSHSKSSDLSKPTQSSMDPVPRALTHYIRSQGNQFKFISNSKTVWEDTLPDSYQVLHNQFIMQDACYKQPNGALVAATGQSLYEHVRQDKLISQNITFEADASFTLQDKNPFYFSCQMGRIHTLHMCPSGQFFLNSACHIIDQCAGEKDGKTLADPYDTQRFYECHGEKAFSKACPPDTYFAYSKCIDPRLLGLYCYATERPKILNSKTVVICRDGKITYDVCPPGFRYFDSPKCEPEACVGQPDGSRIPLPNEQIGPLSFSPGYMECYNDKVKSTVTCPVEWDTHLSKGEDLTHLPRVFDGHDCAIPEFCVNVTPNEPDVVVPVHDFSKHVRNWVNSEYFDRVKGYKCEGSTRKRVSVEPGEMIFSKRFKVESACVGSTERVIVSDNHNDYFDCKTKSVQTCPANHFFNGHECQPSMDYPFKYDGLEMFQLDSLRKDNWMEPWEYGKILSVEPCQAPESEYLKTYNVCSHPECVKYPWLSQIQFEIALRDGTLCKFDENTRHIKKEETDDNYLYWAQRRVDEMDPEEKCTPGQNIQSGHLVFDKTIFTTCDDMQPFVFCPSSSTTGIKLVLGQPVAGKPAPSYWACVPPSMKETIPPKTKITFVENEVKQLLPASLRVTDVMINNQQIRILPGGHVEKSQFTLETLDEPVEVEYEYRITHPPEVVWPEQVSRFPGAFLIKKKDFTRLKVHINRYGIKDSVAGFKLT